MQIGAQLYTVREFCTTPEGLSESLKKIAKIGYQTVQISGTCDYDPVWLAHLLDSLSLQCVITHTPKEQLIGEPKKVAEIHRLLNCDYVGLGYCPFEHPDTDYPEFVNTYLPVAKALKEEGKYFMFHNHAREFQKIDGIPILEHLANDFPADLMGFTLDTYWVQTAGADPSAWLERLSGRVPCIHLKDHSFDRKMAVLGEGNLNFDRILASAEKAGTKYLLVEQDDCNGENPFDCLERSFYYLKSKGLE